MIGEDMDGNYGQRSTPGKDTSNKIESEELGAGTKSSSCSPDRLSPCTTTTHVKDVNDANLIASNPSSSESQVEKEVLSEALKDVIESHDTETYLIPRDSMASEKGRSNAEDNKAALKKDLGHGAVENEAPDLHTKPDLQSREGLSLSSLHAPEKRPRSSSPDAILSHAKKRPARICTFFAKGWCIKGNSCKFIHQKEGLVNTNMGTDDLSGISQNEGFLDGTGSREDAERSMRSASQELLNSSNIKSSSRSPLTSQRALIRAYGEGHELPKFHDEQNMYGEHKRPFESSPDFDTMGDRQLHGDNSLPGRYPFEVKRSQVMARSVSLNDAPFTARSTFVPEYGLHSGSLSTSSVYQNNNSSLAYDKKRDDFSIRDQQSPFPSSFSLTSSLKSGFSNSMQMTENPHSVHAFDQARTSSAHGFLPLSAERFDSNMPLDFNRENYGRRSASLPRIFSPSHSGGEREKVPHHELPKDLSTYSGKPAEGQDPWAPSVHFRPSFCHGPPNIPSHRSKYDPLLDSIEPSNIANTSYAASQRTITRDVSNSHMNGDHVLSGIHTPGYSAQQSISSAPQYHESGIGKSLVDHGLTGANAAVAASGPSMVAGVNNFLPKEDKHHIPGHVVGGVNGSQPEAVSAGNLMNKEGKGRNKESRALKFFHCALADFVKELVKPSWREGNLSKDAHKTVVKKAVEKVLGAIQPHQVPSTAELVNQYLSTSRPKILKLVEGYVEKYSKPATS